MSQFSFHYIFWLHTNRLIHQGLQQNQLMSSQVSPQKKSVERQVQLGERSMRRGQPEHWGAQQQCRKTLEEEKFMSTLIFLVTCTVFDRHPAIWIPKRHTTSPIRPIWTVPVEIQSGSQDPHLGTDTLPQVTRESQTWKVLRDFGRQFFSWLWVKRQRLTCITMDSLYSACWH